MNYKSSGSWYEDDNLLKRRLFYAFNRLLTKIYRNPIIMIGIFLGVIFSKMPIIFSSSLKERINLTTIMPPESLGIKVVVDRRKDHGRAQFCNKERLTCEWIEKYYNKGDVIYDVGANIGAVSLVAAMYLDRDCEIYSFEPLPTTYSMLFKNIIVNNCEKVITPLNIALSNKIKAEQLHLTSIEAGSSGHGVSGSVDNENDIIKDLTVFTQTLDNIIKSYHINKPNHIKIDVDGHDYEVLLGGENIFQNDSLRTILIERNDDQDKIRALVEKHGFVEVDLKDEQRGEFENMGFIRSDLI